MGDEINCLATIEGKPHKVRALLESDEIILRGEARLRVPIAAISHLETDGDTLHIDHPGGRVSLALGTAKAERWRDRILHPKSRIEKLGVKPGMTVDAPAALQDELAQGGATIQPEGLVDLLFLTLEDRVDLTGLARIRERGAAWIIRPRGGPLKESEVREAARAAGWVDVKVVRFSATHTAEKFTRRKP